MASVGITTTAFGVFYSFSVFLTAWLDQWHVSRAFLSGVFSLSFLMYGLASVAMGYLADKFGLRRAIALGGFIMGAGCILCSLVQSAWSLYLSWGLAVGIGVGSSYSPTATAVSRWFIRKKGLCVGLVVSGLGLGTVIYPPIFESIIAGHGWRTAAVVLGLVVWALYLAAVLIIRGDPSKKGLAPLGQESAAGQATGTPGKAAKSAPQGPGVVSLSLPQAIRTRSMWLLFVIHGLWVLGMSMSMVHLVPYAIDLGVSSATAALMLSLVGALSVAGRVVLAVVIERLGTKWSLVCLIFVQAVSMLLLTFDGSEAILWCFTVLFGFTYGGLASVFPLATSEYFGLKHMGSIFGVILLGATLGGTAGPAFAGRIFDLTQTYHLAFLSAFSAMIVGGLLPFLLKPAAANATP